VGVLEALGKTYWDDETRIWESDPFPVRFKTRLVSRVSEDQGIHLHEVVEQSRHARSWGGFYRASPQRLPREDGEWIVGRLAEIAARAAGKPEPKPVQLTVGGPTPESPGERPVPEERPRRDHDRIQYRLLKLGRDLKFDLWVARNDRGKVFDGERFGDMSLDELPIRFDETTRGTIELIDVLWIQRNRIEAAFEIESTTSIYSGLLRMADLLAMQPNIDIPLYIVGPDERRNAVFREIRRPVFSNLRPPLAKACSYISFKRLEDELEALGPRTKHLRVSFLGEVAERAA
jgi:hypothetical protein